MSTALTLFQTQLGHLLSADAAELSTTARIEMIKAAVAQYGRDRPDDRTEDVTGNDTRYYALATVLDQWVEDFSRVRHVEYPAADLSSDEVPTYLEPDDWQDDYWAEVSGTLTRHLYLPNHSIASTETLRIKYTVPYYWTAGTPTAAVAQAGHGLSVDDFIVLSGSTWVATADYRGATNRVTAVADVDNFTHGPLVVNVPQLAFFAICHLAACYSCRAIATKYASATDTTINADSTAHSSRSAEFANRANEFCKAYSEAMGLGAEGQGPGVQAAGDFVYWPTSPDWPYGREYIYHGRQQSRRN